VNQRVSLALFVLASLAPAQLTLVQRADVRADLLVELTAKSDERATLTVPVPLDQALGSAFARAVGCQPNDLQPAPYPARLNVHCSIRRSAQAGLHTQVRLSELAERLGALGVKQLEVEFTFPKLGDVTITPAIPSRGSYRMTSYAVDAVPKAFTIDVGINKGHVRTLAAGTAGLMLLPFVLMLVKPRTLIHLIATTQALFLLGWAAWTWVLLDAQAWTLCELASGNAYTTLLLLFATPLAPVWIGSQLAAIHYARLAPPGANVALYRQAKFWIGGIVVFLFTTIFGVFAGPDDTGIFGLLCIGLGGAILCVVRLRLASRGSSHPLTAGELRQRIFELAARAGVRIRGVTILTGSETRPPAAFATRWGGILLTDGLLKRLPKREVDAIVCHELSHTGSKSKVMMYVLYVFVLCTTMAAEFVPGTVMLFPLLIVALVLSFKAWRRSQERAADRDSVGWSRDPEAMISGLARVSLVSGMPLDWGAPISWMLSHPSTGERLRLIAAAGGVPQSRVAELVEQARSEPADHYAESSDVPADAAFSPMLRQRMRNSLGWYALAAPAIFGVGIAWALERTGIAGFSVFAIGAPVSMAAFYFGYEMIVGKMRETARRRAVARNGPGIFVGFSPSAEPRIYEGMYHYDFGLVRFSPGVLEFVGDRTHFTLDSRLAERVWLGDGPRHWTPRKVVYVACRNSAETSSVFSLQSFEARVWPWTTIAARRLHKEVEIWRRRHIETVPPPPPCAVPLVAGDPDQIAGLSTVVKSVAIYAGIGLTVTTMFGMADLERGFDWGPTLLCAALAIFAAWPRIIKPRTA
jgi:Zn-dependent protease with chaperone function